VADVGLLVFLAVYTLLGAAFAFNLGRASDRAAEYYRTRTWLGGQIGGRNPQAWRAGGLITLTFGAIVFAWILVASRWQLPTLNTNLAIAVLISASIACTLALLRSRRN
jgi:hypothetical protein